jgi:hypothetical protein
MGVATPKPPLTIHPHSKLCGILAIFHKVGGTGLEPATSSV